MSDHNILIAESLEPHTLQTLTSQYSHLNWTYKPDISIEHLEEIIKDYHVLIVRPKQVTRKAIENADKLKLIIRGGAGVNSIDCAAAAEKNIIVENTPGLNSTATAEFTFQMMQYLFTKRRMFRSADAVKTDALLSLSPDPYQGIELKGKTIAILGLGNIGQAVARMCVGFNMNVIAYSKSFTAENIDPRVKALGIQQANNIEQAIASADIITLHMPLTQDTHHIINPSILEHAKANTTLINTARPQLISPESLPNIAALAIDGDPDVIEPFIKYTDQIPTLITHHIADNTLEAQSNIAKACIEQAVAFLDKNEIINGV